MHLSCFYFVLNCFALFHALGVSLELQCAPQAFLSILKIFSFAQMVEF